jgi:2,4-dienoyl-CoA reductase-like NADH-dependent reductase (Old Yellow Enzyme family)
MSTLESRLEKAKKVLKELQEEVDEKKKTNYRMSMAEWSNNKEYVKERALLNKLKVAKATVGRLETKIHNKKGGRTRRARGSKKTRKNGF